LQHAPRFFIVHPDLSGTELLRYEDISQYLHTAEHDNSTAVIKEPVMEYPGMSPFCSLPDNLYRNSMASFPDGSHKEDYPRYGRVTPLRKLNQEFLILT